jgi:hypothetical protein
MEMLQSGIPLAVLRSPHRSVNLQKGTQGRKSKLLHAHWFRTSHSVFLLVLSHRGTYPFQRCEDLGSLRSYCCTLPTRMSLSTGVCEQLCAPGIICVFYILCRYASLKSCGVLFPPIRINPVLLFAPAAVHHGSGHSEYLRPAECAFAPSLAISSSDVDPLVGAAFPRSAAHTVHTAAAPAASAPPSLPQQPQTLPMRASEAAHEKLRSNLLDVRGRIARAARALSASDASLLVLQLRGTLTPGAGASVTSAELLDDIALLQQAKPRLLRVRV